jgi:hypothetical protein
VSAATAAAAAAATPALLARPDEPPRFGADIQPIFDAKCVSCHPVAYPYLDLRRGLSYDGLVRVAAKTRPAFYRVLPGRPELSYLLTHPPDPSQRDLMTGNERQTIAAWIRAGGRDD